VGYRYTSGYLRPAEMHPTLRIAEWAEYRPLSITIPEANGSGEIYVEAVIEYHILDLRWEKNAVPKSPDFSSYHSTL